MKLTLAQMFSLSRLIEFQNIIGYKAALTKLYHQFLDNKNFARIVSLFEEIKINAGKVNQEKAQEKKEIFIKAQEYKRSKQDLPDDIKSKINEFNVNLLTAINEKNKEHILELNQILTENKEEFEFEFNELLVKAIKNVIESEKSVQELKLEQAIVDSLMEVYSKL